MAEPGVIEAFDVLLAQLRQEQERGQTHVSLTPQARTAMREWHLSLRKSHKAAPPSSRVEQAAVVRTAVPPRSTPLAAPAPAPATSASAENLFARPAASKRPAALAALQQEVRACPVYADLRARGLLRETMVYSTGNPDSPLVFIGEAPGAEEETQGAPFVGPAGQLLTKMITAMGLKRADVYITNIVKYRPTTGEPNQGSKNRKPTAEEIAAGLPHLIKELQVLQPKVIVALGATALEGLCGSPVAITRARGQWMEFQGIPLMPTFHPSYLLRQTDSLTEKRKAWEDMLQVMEKLQLPISAKQRAFFKLG